MVKINYLNKVIKEIPDETSLLDISKDFEKFYNFPILAGKINNTIEELDTKITRKCDIDFYDRSSIIGNTIYSHSVHFLMIVAAKKVLGDDTEIIIDNSLDKGVYCEIKNKDIDKEIIDKIENKMQEMVKQDYRFMKISVTRRDAINFFKKKKQMDKVNLLKYISNTYVNLYRLDEYYDYFFSEMVYSTKYLDDFKLHYIEGNGFVLSCPSIHNPKLTENYKHPKLIYEAFKEYSKVGETIGIRNAADLNQLVSLGKYDEIIRLAEAHYDSQLARVADIIHNKEKVKIILIAGPTSSGKTTTARKLEVYLQARGFRTHSISTDDYFLNRVDTPKDSDGDYDFESLRAIDIDLLNKQFLKLLDGEKVLLPEFNFITGEREYNKKWLQLESQDIIIMEGLHALNDDLTIAIEDKYKYKIFISPLTQINIDDHNRIHTSDTRRLRRIVRDSKYRGYSASQTLKSWEKVLLAENKYVYPYQNEADVLINSSLIYEWGVLRTYAEPLLFSVDEDDENYPEAIRLINFLRNFLPIPADNISNESVLREFIGGSSFHKEEYK